MVKIRVRRGNHTNDFTGWRGHKARLDNSTGRGTRHGAQPTEKEVVDYAEDKGTGAPTERNVEVEETVDWAEGTETAFRRKGTEQGKKHWTGDRRLGIGQDGGY